MLELTFQLRPAIIRYAAIDKRYTLSPSEMEWDAMKELVQYLKIFYDATLKLSGIRKMFAKWDKYWQNENILLPIACVLDPRCKMAVVKYYFQMMYPNNCLNFISNLKACMNVLFKEYLEAQSKIVEKQAGSSSQHERKTSSASSSVSDIRAELKNFIRGMKNIEPIKSDLEQYLADALDDASLDVEFDILTWWKLKAPRYPVLTQLTRDILVVPILTVALESIFSTSGKTLSSVRNSLNDESIEALICARDWLRAPVTENGVEVGDPLFTSDEVPMDDSICGSGA